MMMMMDPLQMEVAVPVEKEKRGRIKMCFPNVREFVRHRATSVQTSPARRAEGYLTFTIPEKFREEAEESRLQIAGP